MSQNFENLYSPYTLYTPYSSVSIYIGWRKKNGATLLIANILKIP